MSVAFWLSPVLVLRERERSEKRGEVLQLGFEEEEEEQKVAGLWGPTCRRGGLESVLRGSLGREVAVGVCLRSRQRVATVGFEVSFVLEVGFTSFHFLHVG